MRRLSTEEFVRRANIIHDNFYDYSCTEYTAMQSKVSIICPKHGKFEQTANCHLQDQGCPYCNDRRYWTEQEKQFVIDNFRLIGAKSCAKILKRTVRSIYKIVHDNKSEIPKKFAIEDKIPRFLWQSLERGAIDRRIELKITIEDIWIQYNRQNGKCALTGWDIVFDKNRSVNTASVDRIDSSKGYLKDNIQIVHKRANRSKLDLKEEVFFHLCEAVAGHRTDLIPYSQEWHNDSWNDTIYPVTRGTVKGKRFTAASLF